MKLEILISLLVTIAVASTNVDDSAKIPTGSPNPNDYWVHNKTSESRPNTDVFINAPIEDMANNEPKENDTQWNVIKGYGFLAIVSAVALSIFCLVQCRRIIKEKKMMGCRRGEKKATQMSALKFFADPFLLQPVYTKLYHTAPLAQEEQFDDCEDVVVIEETDLNMII